jgi:polyhydroxyalkanoate synthase subunit PhaE
MSGSAEQSAHDPTMSAFATGMEHWATLMQALARTPPGSAEFQKTLLSMRDELATQMEAWLRSSHPFTGLRFGPPMQASAFTGLDGIGGAFGPAAQRMTGLLSKWVHLQSKFAAHWSTIGRAAAEKFGAQPGTLTVSGQPTDLRKVYDLWIDCAEAAYAETAHSEPFARAVAEAINTAVALQVEGRQYLQQWTRTAGLPTREEVDALKHRIDQLERAGHRRPREKTSRKKKASRKTRRKGTRRA